MGMRKCPDCKQDLVGFGSVQEAREGGVDRKNRVKNVRHPTGDDFFNDGEFLED
jgi:hypothetical protein